MKRLRLKSNAGFTLVEIMLVIIIIIGLMAVLIPNLIGARDRANISTAGFAVERFKNDIIQYESSNKRPPSTEQGLRALVEKPSGDPVPRQWVQIETQLDDDPWGTPYQYEYPGKHNPKSFDIFSAGPDRIAGTEDDIGNWKTPQSK